MHETIWKQGNNIEQIFPFMGIRFIAINDNYDSKDFVGGIADIDVQFKSLLYDFYSKDLSQKVSTAVMARKDKGMFIGICAPFGYLKSKDNACELLVDEEAAAVVKRIFTLRTAYESYVKGITDKGTYLMQKESYEVMISGIKEKIEAQKEAIIALENQKPSDISGIKFLERNSQVTEITDELLDVLLEKIVVYADKTIELRWKFTGRRN